MERALLISAALVVGAGSWFGLNLFFRYSSIPVLEELTFWISPIATTGWVLCIVLIAMYYGVFSFLWHSFRRGV
jgi:hypothetical protein